MDAHGPDLEKLSISELESLIAEKRRRESKRMLRTIAGRAPVEPSAPPATLRPAGLAGPEPPPRKGRITRRLSAEEARAALARAAAGVHGRGAAAPPADRFRRSSLAAVARPRKQHGPAWLQTPQMRKGIDLGLQLAEVAFVLLFFYVVFQWLFADSQTDDNIAAEMAAVQVPAHTAAPKATNPLPQVGGALQVPVAGKTPTPPEAPVAAIESRDDVIRNRLAGAGGLGEQAVLDQVTTTITSTMAGAAGTPAADNADAVESNPALPTEIRIPKIKLDSRVREVTVRFDTWEWEVADFMAGHHTGTANPGDTGNVVIAGHRDIRGSVFLNLDKLKKGDDIFVYSGRGIFHYIVRTTKVVKPTAIEVMAPTSDARLTLITCTPVKIASHRLIVIADLDPKYVAPDRAR
jgi:LPXTG-site transpeptidase (sortase) family protein